MTIMDKRDRFCPHHRSAPARFANDLGNRRLRDIFSARDFIGFLDGLGLGVLEWSKRIDARPKLAICEKGVAVWVNASRDRSAVHVRSADVNGMMMRESHAFLREFPKRGRVAFAYEIRP